MLIAQRFIAGLRSIANAESRSDGCKTPMSNSYVSQLMHCVFSTKERRPMITPELQERMIPYLGGIAREHNTKLIAAGGIDDHMHLLLSLPKTLNISKAMQLLKGGSSK